eukprot:CCRYP_014385-RA/>CCRYP_014385-RA protein AED:0.39 eAED:-0.67 QI:0/0/0/1/0/0/2/0/468
MAHNYTINSKISNPSFSAVEIDKQVKRQLVVNTITKHCSSKLCCKILSGGYTNYSYKVYVKDQPDVCVFSKLSFEFALWNPDKSSHYDLKRTENEWEIMMTISRVAPDCVVSPLDCWDVDQDGQRMKLLVTEWSNADEQFANQFIDGYVDPRIAPKLADLFAAPHSIHDFAPNFNSNVQPCMENIFEQMRSAIVDYCSSRNPQTRTQAYCVSVGNKVAEVIEEMIRDYHRQDCLIHSDAHAFNILVESKPSVAELEGFGPSGKFVLCDWEMSMAGPMGRDVGLALSFPIACLIAHGINSSKTESINEYITSLLDCYCSRMVELGKTENEITALYRNIIGWSGYFQFGAFYFANCFVDFFPVQNARDREYVRDAMGILGLKLMRFSFDPLYLPKSTNIDQMKVFFRELLEDEVSRADFSLTTTDTEKKPRMSSSLRAADRRLSDAMVNFATTDLQISLSFFNESNALEQ